MGTKHKLSSDTFVKSMELLSVPLNMMKYGFFLAKLVLFTSSPSFGFDMIIWFVFDRLSM